MDWDALGAIAELLGALAVFMTLVYLAVQLKQNNAFAQAQAMQARTDTQLNMISFVLSDPKYLRSIRKTVSSIAASEKEGLSEEDKATANIILGVMRTTLENTFEQYRKGLIGEDFYQGITVQTIKTFGPAILSQDLWLTPDFKKEIEMILISS